jgi:hypothetical protein
MTPMIVLKNRGPQRFIFSLYHELVCRKTDKCSCRTVLERNEAGRMVPVRYPASVQIDARSESLPLPAAVYNVPQVRRAVTKPPYRLERQMLSQEEYDEIVAQQVTATEKRRKRLVDAKRAEQGLPPLHKVQEATEVAEKPARKSAPKTRTPKSEE